MKNLPGKGKHTLDQPFIRLIGRLKDKSNKNHLHLQ